MTMSVPSPDSEDPPVSVKVVALSVTFSEEKVN